MSTLGVMKARIASELSRSNLADEIASAITDAISVYQTERFRFSSIDPANPPVFNTVATRWIYDSNDNENINTLYTFDYVMIEYGGTLLPLRRESAAYIKMMNETGTMSGQPEMFAYEGGKLLLSPIPAGAYEITLGVMLLVAAPARDDETDNQWMTTAEMLIRSRAKYEIALHKTRNPTMAVAMSPHPPGENGGTVGAAYEAWKRLKGVSNRVASRGRVRPMQF